MTEQRKPTIDCLPLSWGQIKAVSIDNAYAPEPTWTIKDHEGQVFDDGLEKWSDVVASLKNYAEQCAIENNRQWDGMSWTADFSDPDLCNDDGTECIFIRRSIGFEVVDEENCGPYDGMNFYYEITVDGQDLGCVK